MLYYLELKYVFCVQPTDGLPTVSNCFGSVFVSSLLAATPLAYG